MSKEKDSLNIEKQEKLKGRLNSALRLIKSLENYVNEDDIYYIECTAAQVAERIEIERTGRSSRSWYPMSGTIDEIEKDLK